MFFADVKNNVCTVKESADDKVIVEKAKRQLCTSIPVKLYHDRVHSFIKPVNQFKPIVTQLNGLITSQEYLALSALDDIREEYLFAGLNDDEILFKLKYESDPPAHRPKQNPLTQNRLAEINELLDSHKKNAKRLHPDDYKIAYSSKRHLENDVDTQILSDFSVLSDQKNRFCDALNYAENRSNADSELQCSCSDLVENKPCAYPEETCRPIHQEKILIGPRTKKQAFDELKFYLPSSPKGFCISKKDVEAVSPEEIQKFKMSSEEIRRISKFSSWQIGQPNTTLFVKNLPKNISEEMFAGLFIHFQLSDKAPLIFRLCTGKMRGQGFVTFPELRTAEEALNKVNGFLIRGKPVVISFSTR